MVYLSAMDRRKLPRRRLDGPALDIKPVAPRSATPPAPPAPAPEPVAEPTPEPALASQPATSKQPKRRRFFKRFRMRKPTLKQVGIAAGALVLATLLFFGIKLFLATTKIITRNSTGGAPALAGNVDPTKLKGEGDGRVNILLLGIGGPGHSGAYLSDTMMVVSIDPRTKDVAMISIPRDLYVPISGYGYGKINSANAYGEQTKSGNGPVLAKQTVQKVLDIPIHYYAQIDFQGFKKAVDAVGGIDINVTQALSDPSYPCDKNESLACGFNLKAGQTHMDGTLALKYARCRKGNCGNDFGRAQRQQEVLVALRQKALSLGTLANPAKIASLIDIVGDSARTDLQLSEMKKLADIAKDIDTSKIVNKVIDEEQTGLLKGVSDPVAGSILIPAAGSGNFGKIQEFVHSVFVDNYLIRSQYQTSRQPRSRPHQRQYQKRRPVPYGLSQKDCPQRHKLGHTRHCQLG